MQWQKPFIGFILPSLASLRLLLGMAIGVILTMNLGINHELQIYPGYPTRNDFLYSIVSATFFILSVYSAVLVTSATLSSIKAIRRDKRDVAAYVILPIGSLAVLLGIPLLFLVNIFVFSGGA
jgi:magnesium-transporting ATPase (P-type)